MKIVLGAFVSGVSLGQSSEVDAPKVNIPYAVLEINENHHELVEKLYFDRLTDFVYVELMRGLQRGFVPKRCANCGRWFLQTPGASYNYCGRPAPNSEEGKTYREVGSAKSFRAKVLNNEIWAIHQRAYKKYFAQTKKGAMTKSDFGNIHLHCSDAINLYNHWETPIVIISDGPYEVNGFPGDLVSPQGLDIWYEPHIREWSNKATPLTTLWFWNIEIGWATVHPMLEKYGWSYVSCCVWDKGMSHVAGNTNTKTIRHLPVVTEVCVQYVKKPQFTVDQKHMSMKEWLRYEWGRTGLPFSKTNEACEVKDAATRKYFTKCHLWYMLPADAFEKIAIYANEHGKEDGRPYFSIDGKKPVSKEEWANMRSKFYCPIGVTSVWQVPQLRNNERLKINQKAVHLNQKPLSLIKRTIEMCSDIGDIVWDPFAGLCTTAIACGKLDRECYCAEINEDIFQIASGRVKQALQEGFQCALQ